MEPLAQKDRLKLDSLLGLNALRERVFDLPHLGDEVADGPGKRH